MSKKWKNNNERTPASVVADAEVAGIMVAAAAPELAPGLAERIVEEPVIVPEPIVVANAPATVVPVKAVPAVASIEIQTIRTMIDAYVTAANANFISDVERTKMLTAMNQLVRYVMAHTSTEVLDEMYKFFMKYATSLVAPDTFLQSINTLPVSSIRRLSSFYAAMMELVRCKTKGKKFALDLKAIRHELNNEAIVLYIDKKLK